MLSRPLDLASRLRPEPRNFDWLFIVNGGLIALMLVEAARPKLPGTIAGYDARAMAPLFMGQTVQLNSRIVGDTAETWASSADGVHYRVNISLNKK